MTVLKVWTTRKLTALGIWLASAFGFGASAAQSAARGDTWTPATLTRFGLEMTKGFGPGL